MVVYEPNEIVFKLPKKHGSSLMCYGGEVY